MEMTSLLNPVAEQLRSAAASAPFKLEKENYLCAVEEIERLHQLLNHPAHCQVPRHLLDEIAKLLATCTHTSRRAAKLLHMLNEISS